MKDDLAFIETHRSDRRRSVNPLYDRKAAFSMSTQQGKSRFALLPLAPITASPVPRLTSLYHFNEPGAYGDQSYPGNCGGNLIRDLLLYYKPLHVLDPMMGSGTCADVCRTLNVPCRSEDIRHGFDATDPVSFHKLGGSKFDFIWAHPPYWRQKLYSTHPRDLSRTATLEAFLNPYASFIQNCTGALADGGKFAILMGDYCDRKAGFIPLTYHTKHLAFASGLRQSCTDIVRFSHGASSSHKTYESSFIPGLHDMCMVFEKR